MIFARQRAQSSTFLCLFLLAGGAEKHVFTFHRKLLDTPKLHVCTVDGRNPAGAGY